MPYYFVQKSQSSVTIGALSNSESIFKCRNVRLSGTQSPLAQIPRSWLNKAISLGQHVSIAVIQKVVLSNIKSTLPGFGSWHLASKLRFCVRLAVNSVLRTSKQASKAYVYVINLSTSIKSPLLLLLNCCMAVNYKVFVSD